MKWLRPLGWYCILQVVVLTTIMTHWQFALLLWFGVLVLVTAVKRRELVNWWRAWDERGKPIDVEVLPDAKVTRE
jgi:hypothetical protein